jgi:hypothetical protein
VTRRFFGEGVGRGRDGEEGGGGGRGGGQRVGHDSEQE